MSASIEARFTALLNANAEELDDHLRHVIGLLRAHERPLDWFRLFSDLLHWDDLSGSVQLAWARDF
jgi:CRISPR system Cascade subunit CasB